MTLIDSMILAAVIIVTASVGLLGLLLETGDGPWTLDFILCTLDFPP